MDWVGILIERITEIPLGQYINENIFKPLGMENSAMVLKDGMRSNLSSMHARDNNGMLRVREHLNKVARDTDENTNYFHSGGAGLFSNATDYCSKLGLASSRTKTTLLDRHPLGTLLTEAIEILAALLNNGLSPTTSKRILESRTVDQMFQNQIPDWQGKYAGRGHAICRTDLAVAVLQDDVPVVGREGWGLSFLLEGDSLQFASAAGISNCFWALDREMGTAAVLFSQVLPLGDPVIFPLWQELQKLVFA
jgi:CubicO group peptidase (beta-lactamase class C family)